MRRRLAGEEPGRVNTHEGPPIEYKPDCCGGMRCSFDTPCEAAVTRERLLIVPLRPEWDGAGYVDFAPSQS